MGQTLRKSGYAYGTCDRCGKDFVKVARSVPYQFCSIECSVVPMEQRFMARVDVSGECWIWNGKRNSDGYGELQVGKKIQKAHRIALQICGIDIPDGAEVCHTCDNPSCVRPSHLFIGTHSDNMRDMVKKGRGVIPKLSGSAHGGSKLAEAEVIAIRSDPRPQSSIAASYGISQSLVSQIKRGKVRRQSA